VPGMAAAVGMFLLTAGVVNRLFSFDWPLLGPALFLAVATACVQATLLLSGPNPVSQAIGLGLVATLLGVWLKSRYGDPGSQPEHLWTTVTTTELATMLLAGVAAFGGTRLALAWERCGEPLSWPRVREYFGRWIDDLESQRPGPTGSRQKALYWYEWQQKGLVLPSGVAMILLGILGAWFWEGFQSDVLFGGLLALGMGLPFGGLIGGLLFGSIHRKVSGPMGSFLASRPATNSELSAALLKTMAKSLVTTWSLWLVALCVAMGLTRLFVGGDWNQFVQFPNGLLQPDGLALWSGTILLCLWAISGLIAAGLLVGRPELVASVCCGAFLTILGSVFFAAFGLRPDQATQFYELMILAIALLCGAGTTAAFVAARRAKLVAAATPWIALWIWALLTATVVPSWNGVVETPSLTLFLIPGLLSLVVAPFALVPLAIASNRHR
jgi:hypothetical protein